MAAVLYVDPDDETAHAVADGLRDAGHESVTLAASVEDAVSRLADYRVDCLVTEYALPDGTGLELVDRVRDVAPDTVCLLYTAADADDIPTDGAAQVVDWYFKASTPPAQLAAMVESAVSLRSHTAYPLPEDEGDRLAALETFDFDSEALGEALERITDLAARHFGVRTASVNAIEERTQTFLACHGADWSETAREDSICTYAIVDDDPVTVVEDTAADPRFEDNETLKELGIRFYAGADLTTDGFTIGTLCVYDDVPRSFSDEDRDYLALLAEEAGHVLTIHRELEGADPSVGSP